MTRRQIIPPARELRPDSADGTRQPHELIDEIASELNHLHESRLNPHAFFERRDMIVKRLRRLSKRMSGADSAPPTTVWRAPAR